MENLKKVINKSKPKHDVVCFYFFDIYHDNKSLYTKPEGVSSSVDSTDNLKILETIKNSYDFEFDKFRYRFFKSLTDVEALEYKKLKLISEIIPFWELESHLL